MDWIHIAVVVLTLTTIILPFVVAKVVKKFEAAGRQDLADDVRDGGEALERVLVRVVQDHGHPVAQALVASVRAEAPHLEDVLTAAAGRALIQTNPTPPTQS